MKSFAIGLLFVLGVGGAFMLGDLLHTDENGPRKELTQLYTDLFKRKDLELHKLKGELEEARLEIKALRSSKENLAATADEANKKLSRYENVLSHLTDGRAPVYEILRDGGEAVVFIGNTPNDDDGREIILMKLGVTFSGYDAVSFWHDKALAQNFIRGRLERNEDASSPPYDGMFGEITATANGSTLLLYKSSGGVAALVFGKFIK